MKPIRRTTSGRRSISSPIDPIPPPGVFKYFLNHHTAHRYPGYRLPPRLSRPTRPVPRPQPVSFRPTPVPYRRSLVGSPTLAEADRPRGRLRRSPRSRPAQSAMSWRNERARRASRRPDDARTAGRRPRTAASPGVRSTPRAFQVMLDGLQTNYRSARGIRSFRALVEGLQNGPPNRGTIQLNRPQTQHRAGTPG